MFQIKRNPVEQLFAGMDRNAKRTYMREYRRQCAKWPEYMKAQVLPEDMQGAVLGAWRSNRHLAVAWPSDHPTVLCRLTVNRADIDEQTGSWLQGISWDDLYRIKNECGYKEYDAVEIFPAEDKLVNVANMRHLWVMKDRIAFGLDKG